MTQSWWFDQDKCEHHLELDPLVRGSVWSAGTPAKWYGKAVAIQEHIIETPFDTVEEAQAWVEALIEAMVLTAYEHLFPGSQVRQ